MANRRMRTVVRSWEEKEGKGGAKIRSAVIATIRTRGERRTSKSQHQGGMTLMRILPCVRKWSCRTYNWQLEREEVQRRMRWKMIEEEWS